METAGSLELLSAFTTALSHRIRSSLSVIASDLEYLGTVAPAGECGRALTRVREISDLLSDVRGALDCPSEADTLTVAELARGAASVNVDIEPQLGGLTLLISRRKLSLIFRLISDLFRSCGCDAPSFTLRDSPPELVIASRRADASPIKQTLESSSFTAMLSALGVESIEAPLVDAVLSGCTCGVRCYLKNDLFQAVIQLRVND